MRYIRELDEPSIDDGCATVESSSIIQENPIAVSNLFKRPWFFRVWVLQEITFAQKATVIYGDYQLNWKVSRRFIIGMSMQVGSKNSLSRLCTLFRQVHLSSTLHLVKDS